MGQPMIDIKTLSASYGRGARRVNALRGVDLQVQAGEIFGLLGPNGACKTTLLAAVEGGDQIDGSLENLRTAHARGVRSMLIAASCSKNFGVYRDRAGILISISADAEQAKIAQGNLNFLNRQTYSFPPDHGTRTVMTVLEDASLEADCEAAKEKVRSAS